MYCCHISFLRKGLALSASTILFRPMVNFDAVARLWRTKELRSALMTKPKAHIPPVPARIIRLVSLKSKFGHSLLGVQNGSIHSKQGEAGRVRVRDRATLREQVDQGLMEGR